MKPGVLLIITLVFTLAFITRAVGTVADLASESDRPTDHAESSGAAATSPGAENPPHADAHAGDADAKEGQAGGESHKTEFEMVEEADEDNADFSTLAAMIRTRTQEIERRIVELDDRERTLDVVEARVDEKLKQLEAAQSALAETAARVDAASDKDVQALAAMYANMKPQQAGAIFNAMEPSFAAGFLTSMRPETAAAILAGMEPQKAYAVSVIIAGRNVGN